MILKENSLLNRYEWASEKIKIISDEQDSKQLSVFDIGSRDNVLNGYLQGRPVTYKGFDLDPITDSAEQWNVEEPFPYPYAAPQIVTFLEVLEHLNNPWLCLKNITNLIAPGGYLILTTPNPKWSTSRVDLLVNGRLTCFTQSDLDLNHHVFIPWVHIVEKLLTDSDLEIVEYVTLDGKTRIFDKKLTGGNIIKRLFSRIIKKYIESRDPSACGMSYGVIAKKVG
jgi:hypothetical protein